MAKARRGRRRPSGQGRTDDSRDLHDPRLGGSLREHQGSDGRPKVAYGTQDEAQRASFDRRLHDGIDLDVYRCSICSAWHLARRRE
jgi:hypothetical protein